jgi:hypothetical protein
MVIQTLSAPLSRSLFHGTTNDFKKGDVILPKKKGVAWATPDKEYATNMALQRLDESGMAGKHHVYRVEPLDAQEVKDTNKKHGMTSSNVISTKGFKVMGKIKSTR